MSDWDDHLDSFPFKFLMLQSQFSVDSAEKYCIRHPCTQKMTSMSKNCIAKQNCDSVYQSLVIVSL